MTRNELLYGTSELPRPLRQFACGPLGFALDGGNVRYITWRGTEVLRAISFIVRDSQWGTYAPQLQNLEVATTPDRVVITYDADVSGAEGDFSYSARIEASADGQLTFSGEGSSKTGFRTNRTGFVVLHGLDGVVGNAVEVEHASGGRESRTFPRIVSPGQPIFDIRALTHKPAPGLTVAVRMEGDTFEMEDQRNWTDASFKTYVRPLAMPFPYEIAAKERLEQRVTLQVSETGQSSAASAPSEAAVTIGAANGTMPEIGVALSDWRDWPVVATSYLVGRIDLTAESPHIPVAPEGVAIDLDVIIPGRDPERELAPLAELPFTPRRVLVVPKRDMLMRPTEHTPAGEAGYDRIVAAARRVFPHSQVGGGMLVQFTELNRNRPPKGIDFVAHTTTAIVHAADDYSVMETLEAVPSVIASVRAFAGEVPYRLGPATIGAPQPFYPAATASNPEGIRKPTADADPRQRGLFAAAFAIGYAAATAEGRVDALTLGCTSGAAGMIGPAGPYPVATSVAWLAELAGQTRRHVDAPAGLAVVAADGPNGKVLLVANLGAEPRTFTVAGFTSASVLDIEALEDEGKPRDAVATGHVALDAYAVWRGVDG